MWIKKISKTLVAIVVMVVILISLSYINFLYSKNNIVKMIYMQNANTLESIVVHLQEFFNEKVKRLIVLSNIMTEKGSDIQYYIENEYKEYGHYYAIGYLDINGNYLFRVPNNENYINKNANDVYVDSFITYLKKAQETKEPQITDVYNIDEKKLGITIIVPLMQEDKVIGFLGSTFDMEKIGDNIIYNKIKDKENVIFGVTKKGIRVFCMNEEYVGKDIYNIYSGNDNALNKLAKDNYTKMIKGEPFEGEHDEIFNTTMQYNLLKETVNKYIVSRPVYLDKEGQADAEDFKFSLAVTIPENKIKFVDMFIINQMMIFISLLLVSCLIYIIIKNFKEKQKLEQTLAEAEASEKLKTEFFCNMSHELRTPLTIILNGMHFILRKYEGDIEKDTELKKMFLKVRQNAFRLLKLVNNLLEISRLDQGGAIIKFQNLDIVKITEDITMSVVYYAQQKGINIVFDTQIEEKVVAVDEDGIEKVIMNLLSNAVKFTPSGGKILVNIYEDDKYVNISVKDTGVGIPADKKKFIFEKFTQVDNIFRRSAEGTGMGLSIVRAIVEMHNGNIEVISKEGKGTEFIVQIPNITIKEQGVSTTKKLDKEIVNNINIEFSDV